MGRDGANLTAAQDGDHTGGAPLPSTRGRVAWGMKRLLLAATVLAALVIAPFAIAAGEGKPVRSGVRNPSPDASKALTRETEIIANTATYGTRQSNKSDNGGGAVYGCRSGAGGSAADNEPCIRAVNLAGGLAFEFESASGEAGRIEVGNGGDGTRPFTTNATGTATGLNADRVDGFEAAQLAPRLARVQANGTLAPGARGVTAASREDIGVYRVVFAEDVSACTYAATVVGGGGELGFATVDQVDPTTLRVRTAQRAGDNPLADRAFHLPASC